MFVVKINDDGFSIFPGDAARPEGTSVDLPPTDGTSVDGPPGEGPAHALNPQGADGRPQEENPATEGGVIWTEPVVPRSGF